MNNKSSEVNPVNEFSVFLENLFQKHYDLTLISCLSDFLAAKVVFDWDNNQNAHVSKEISLAKDETDKILEAVKEPQLFLYVVRTFAEKIKKHFSFVVSENHLYNPNGKNSQLSYLSNIIWGIRNKDANKKIVNLFGDAPYPSNKPRGLENIFFEKGRYSRNALKFSTLHIALKTIDPYELDLSNIWSSSGYDTNDKWTSIPKVIVASRPSCVRMRNTALLSRCFGYNNLNDLVNSLSKALAIAETKFFDLSWNLLVDKVKILFDALKCTELTGLDLSYNFFDECEVEGWDSLGDLIEYNKITYLNLAGNFFKTIFEEQKQFDAFLSVLKKPSLICVDLSQNRLHELSDANWNKLVQTIEQSNIKQLAIHNPVPQYAGCDIKNHKLTIEKSYGSTSISYAHKNHTSGQSYYVVDNQLTPEKRGQLKRAVKWSLKQYAASALFSIPNARLTAEKNKETQKISYFFTSNKVSSQINEENYNFLNNFQNL